MGHPDPQPDFGKIADVDRLVHEPARLAVMALLYVIESADFTFVMNQTALTWGNLSAHLAKLEEAKYIEVKKTFKGRRPNTSLALSSKGRQAFQQYVLRMKKVFNDLSE